MKLSSVQSLKSELLSAPQLATDSLRKFVLAEDSFRAFVSKTEAVERAMDDIALGVTRVKKQQYRLAIRLQRTGPHVSAMTQQIVEKAAGEVDVREVGTILKFQGPTTASFYRQRRRPLRIGSSIGDVPPRGFTTAGTLGCFVVRREPPLYISLLTNNHVIANENKNKTDSPVAQPGTLDGGKFNADKVAGLWRFIPLKRLGSNKIDAAIADVVDEIDIEIKRVGTVGNLQGLARIVNLPENPTVYKVGRTTGQTKGRVTAFDVDNIRVQYDLGNLRFNGQIEIEGTGSKSFSEGGDSGSLIVDEGVRAVGLLFAGGNRGGSNGKGLTYANPIETVLDALKVDLYL